MKNTKNPKNKKNSKNIENEKNIEIEEIKKRIEIDGIMEEVLKNAENIEVIGKDNYESIIDINFSDIRKIVRGSEKGIIGYGIGKGKNSAIKATKNALKTRLIKKSISGAKKILIHVIGHKNITLMEAQDISDLVRKKSGKKNFDIEFGLGIDRDLVDEVEVIIIIGDNIK